jgi:hypothetical protein
MSAHSAKWYKVPNIKFSYEIDTATQIIKCLYRLFRLFACSYFYTNFRGKDVYKYIKIEDNGVKLKCLT